MILVYHDYSPGDFFVDRMTIALVMHHTTCAWWMARKLSDRTIAVERLQLLDAFPSELNLHVVWGFPSHVWWGVIVIIFKHRPGLKSLGTQTRCPLQTMCPQAVCLQQRVVSRPRRGWRVWRPRSSSILSRSCMERRTQNCWQTFWARRNAHLSQGTNSSFRSSANVEASMAVSNLFTKGTNWAMRTSWPPGPVFGW